MRCSRFPRRVPVLAIRPGPCDCCGVTRQPGPRHGPRQGLTVNQVIDAATALADAEGLDAVTMRRVARASVWSR